jgi:hypothetical protein
LTNAASVVVVGDRDIYYTVASPADRKASISSFVRRKTALWSKTRRCLPARPRGLKLTQMLVKVAPRRVGDPGRIATVALRAGPVTLKRPRNGFAGTDPETVSMTLVQSREINPPANEEPLRWHLLTTIEVADAAAACEIVRLYRLRWRIEEVFRALKSDGMRLEETQVHEAGRLFKLAVVGLAAACRTIQLVDARDGSSRPATDVIDTTFAAGRQSHRPNTGRQDRTAEKPPPNSSSCVAILDRRQTWRLELLL